MKVGENDTAKVIAIATTDSDASSDTQIYNLNEGGKTTAISKIKVNLSRQGSSQGAAAAKPSALADLGEAIVGKQVNETRVLLALILFIIVMIAEGGIIYGAISSAITALGRNPMARKMIRREMVQVILAALAVLAVGLGAVYAILWL